MTELTEKDLVKEAIKRLILFGFDKSVVDNFKEDKIMISDKGKIYMTETHPFYETINEAIDEAKERNLMPYHVIHTSSNFGELYDVLYVSKFQNDWIYENIDEDGYIMSYCYNEDEPEYSEVGTIQIKKYSTGLKRIS